MAWDSARGSAAIPPGVAFIGSVLIWKGFTNTTDFLRIESRLYMIDNIRYVEVAGGFTMRFEEMLRLLVGSKLEDIPVDMPSVLLDSPGNGSADFNDVGKIVELHIMDVNTP
eukprot:CAMPEP_0172503796 /NCGR_PEP_ID=MMETSP1066-20121228/172392_1 /TAXON_ID=671091 /ORGANISM="Coscinodiscus wailesii, Strain CCMP2513" /LENGTH=111 /DNA_ID=CAMNT_0013279681 /DNA_START=238 /DNA_END=569 /DNA_ORIENTATION=-